MLIYTYLPYLIDTFLHKDRVT